MARLIARRNHRCRGLAIVEVALTLPLLMLLILGLLEYAWAFLKVQQINSAAREGVRVGVRADGTNTQIDAAILQMMTLANMQSSGYSVTTTPADVSTAAPGSSITVLVEVAYENIKLIGSPITPMPANLRGEYTMMREGP